MGWWAVKARIIRSQVRWLGSPEGPFVSSMVLGSKAVDLPYDVRDSFIQVGLAHALAVWISNFFDSWFGAGAKQRLSPASQVGCGVSALVIFLGLDWFAAPVLRAVVRVWGNCSGMKRKVKLLGSLLIAATLLLLFNPVDLGSRFSAEFFSHTGITGDSTTINKTVGLVTTSDRLSDRSSNRCLHMDVALQLHFFGVVPLYSLVVYPHARHFCYQYRWHH